MKDDLEEPFVTVAGDGATYRFTWALGATASTREIHDNQPQYWMVTHLLDNIYGTAGMNDLELASALRYQAGELERQAKAPVPSYRIEVGSLSPTAREEIEKFLNDKDYNYNLQEEEND